MKYEVDDYYKGERWSYLVANNEGKYVATLEFVPYRPYSGESPLRPIRPSFQELSIVMLIFSNNGSSSRS